MVLEEFVKSVRKSDRLIVNDSTGELYRGYADCVQYSGLDGKREIKRHGLFAETYRKEEKKVGVAKYMIEGGEVPAEKIGEFQYSDLIVKIYTEIVLEG